MLTSTPVPSSNPARIVSRGTMSTCQQNSSTPRGAVRTQRLSCGAAPNRARQRRDRAADHRRADVAIRLERGRGASRNDAKLERRPRCPRADQHGAFVHGHEPLAAAHLLRRDVREQVPAHRPLVVRAGPLALPRHLGRNERERVELSVRVLERGAGIGALVDDQMQEGGARRRGRASARARRRPRRRTAPRSAPRARSTCSGAWTITSCAPTAGCDAKRSGWRTRDDWPQRVDRARQPRLGGACVVAAAPASPREDQHRVEVRDRAGGPARGVGLAAVRAGGPDLGRRPVLAALAERAASRRLPRVPGPRGRERVGALGPAGREDRAQPGELVDADLGGSSGRLRRLRRSPGRVAGPRSRPEERLDHVERQREDDGRVLVDADVEQRLQVAELERRRVLADDVRRLGELLGRLELAVGGDDLRAPLALGLRLARRSPAACRPAARRP